MQLLVTLCWKTAAWSTGKYAIHQKDTKLLSMYSSGDVLNNDQNKCIKKNQFLFCLRLALFLVPVK